MVIFGHFSVKTGVDKNESVFFHENWESAPSRCIIHYSAPDIQVTFFKTPTIKYFLYEHTLAEASRKAFTLSQMKAFRTDVQPNYHEKQIIINAAGFSRHLNFNNTGT